MSLLGPPPIQEGPEGKGKFSAAWIRWFSQLQAFLIAGGGGGVSNVSFINANGFTGSVANPTTTPAITILSGPGGGGGVSSVGVSAGTGIAASVANPTSTPVISIAIANTSVIPGVY